MTQHFGMHHVGLVVEDLDLAQEFYTSHLGFELDGRTEWTIIDGAPLGINADKVELRWAFLRLGSAKLEIHEFRGLGTSEVRRGTQDPGLGHLALTVQDMGSAVEALTDAGAEFFSEPNLLADSPGQEGDRWVYCRDPLGLTIELYEVAGNGTLDETKRAEQKEKEKTHD